jgi:hypothetical protein|eukprot:COSAG01_NODE_6632_length_3567_cov_1.835206_3_plen_79_part_00
MCPGTADMQERPRLLRRCGDGGRCCCPHDMVSACTQVRGDLDHQGARGQPSRTGMAIAVRNGSRSASPAPKMVSATTS